jgi:hypothetical protein
MVMRPSSQDYVGVPLATSENFSIALMYRLRGDKRFDFPSALVQVLSSVDEAVKRQPLIESMAKRCGEASVLPRESAKKVGLPTPMDIVLVTSETYYVGIDGHEI